MPFAAGLSTAPDSKHALEEVLKQLDSLDAKRSALRPPNDPVAAQISPIPEPPKP